MATQQPALRAKVWLFYLQHASGSLSINIIREICSFLAHLQLAQVTPTFVWVSIVKP